MPGIYDKIRKELGDAASGFKKLGSDLADDGKVNRSNLDRMTLLSLMKKGSDVPKQSDEDEARKKKAVQEGMREARDRVFKR